MNSPPTGVPNSPSTARLIASIVHDSLVRELEGVARDREEATPDIEFPDTDETGYQWKCQVLHNHFPPREADKYRMAIDQREYWELEYLHYHDALQKRLLNKARDGVEGEPTADHWRTLAGFCKGLLRHSGLSATQIREVRQSIDNQEYWKLEAELFERRVALQEYEMREALLRRDRLAHQRRTQSKQRSTAVAERVKRPRPIDQQGPSTDSIASRTRSRTRASAGVAKRGRQNRC